MGKHIKSRKEQIKMEIVSDMVREDRQFILNAKWLNARLRNLPEAKELSEISAVFNPGGVLTPEGKTVLILRFETRKGNSGLVCCESKDGDPFQVIPESLHFSLGDEGLEDSRAVWFPELELYIITYVVATSEKSNVAFITTKNFRGKFARKGEANFIDEPDAPINGRPNKDACVLPVSIEVNGEKHFGLIHRPEIAGKKDIWFSLSSQPIQKRNLIAWENHQRIAETRRGTTFWENSHIGMGPPPVGLSREISRNLPEGLLLFDHGAREANTGTFYRISVMWFSLKDLKITHRSPYWLFGPSGSYRRKVIFPCAAWYDQKIGKIVMYYGEDDYCTRRCYWDVRKLVSHLEKHPV